MGQSDGFEVVGKGNRCVKFKRPSTALNKGLNNAVRDSILLWLSMISRRHSLAIVSLELNMMVVTSLYCFFMSMIC